MQQVDLHIHIETIKEEEEEEKPFRPIDENHL